MSTATLHYPTQSRRDPSVKRTATLNFSRRGEARVSPLVSGRVVYSDGGVQRSPEGEGAHRSRQVPSEACGAAGAAAKRKLGAKFARKYNGAATRALFYWLL